MSRGPVYTEQLFSGTVSASGDTTATPTNWRWAKEGTFFINITAITGGQTLDIELQTYNSLDDTWHKLAEWNQFSGTGTDEGFIGYALGEKGAVKYTLSGGSATFTVNAVLKEF